MIDIDFSGIPLQLKQEEGRTLVFDPVRKKWLVLTPEEHVRQCFLGYIIDTIAYPLGLIAAERKIMSGNMSKRFDVVVYDRNHKPWMLVECKAPTIPLTDATLHQLLQYQRTVQCHYWVITNGHQTFCANAGNISEIKWETELPAYNV